MRVIRTADADLSRVQDNVAAEFKRVESVIPSPRTPSTKVTADYTVKLTDTLILCGPQMPATLNITLPPAATCKRLSFTVKNISATGLVNVRGAFINGARETLDGATIAPCPSGASFTCYSDGVSFWVV